MNKKRIAGAIVAAVLFIAIGVSSVMADTFSKSFLKQTSVNMINNTTNVQLPQRPYVGVVEVYGTIQAQSEEQSVFAAKTGYQHDDTLDYIDQMIEDTNNKGIVLHVDSPGGTIYESEELYLKIKEYKEKTKKPVWTYMEHYAASGGYYISAPSDKIYANPNTVTGSIGVIISGYDMKGLYEKLGIRPVSITSGKNKDMSQMTDEQIAIYQESVNESYERFVEVVADGRKMTTEGVKAIADGRIYTAKQAVGNGLIDEICLYDDAKQKIAEQTGKVEFYAPAHEQSVLSSLFGELKQLKTKSEAEILTELKDGLESGVPMYYAESLR